MTSFKISGKAQNFFWISSGLMIVANDLFKVLTPFLQYVAASHKKCSKDIFVIFLWLCDALKLDIFFDWESVSNRCKVTFSQKLFLVERVWQYSRCFFWFSRLKLEIAQLKDVFNGFGFSCFAHVFKCRTALRLCGFLFDGENFDEVILYVWQNLSIFYQNFDVMYFLKRGKEIMSFGCLWKAYGKLLLRKLFNGHVW